MIRSAGYIVMGLFVLLVSAAAATGAARPSSPPVYSESEVVVCLHHHNVIAGNLPIHVGYYPPTYPPGVAGAVQFFTGLGPKIDGGELFFFKSHLLARTGEAKLISELVYGRGLPPVLKAAMLSQGPIAPGTAQSLYRESGNVVLIWEHPRRHVELSDEMVNSCLAASKKR